MKGKPDIYQDVSTYTSFTFTIIIDRNQHRPCTTTRMISATQLVHSVLLMIALALIVLTLILIFYFWYEHHWKFVKDLRKIPGPPHYPIIGFSGIVGVSREQLFRNERQLALKFYPIFRRTIFHKGLITLLCPEDIELVLTSNIHIQKSKIYNALECWLGTGLLTSYGTKWKTRRKILTPAFHFNILQNFIKTFNEATSRLVEDLKSRQNEPYIDVVPPVTEFTLHSIIETSMGTKQLDSTIVKNYKKAVYDFGRLLLYRATRPWLLLDPLFRLTSTFNRNQSVVKILHDFSMRVINERKLNFDHSQPYTTKKGLAMLDLLLDAKERGANIDDEGIREEVDTFIFEGHDTTSAAICFVLLVLANHQDVQNRIYEEISETIGDDPTYNDLQKLEYTERCLKECLRLYPSVPLITRVAAEDFFTTTGYKIPKGSILHLPIYDLHRNPNVYTDPEKFDPDRFLLDNVRRRHPFAYIPFSAGPRNCIGQRYAMLELKAILCGILRHFTLEAVDQQKDVVFVTDLVLRSKDGIRVKFGTRTKST